MIHGWRIFVLASLATLYGQIGAAAPAFPLKISENRRYLTEDDGKPFLIVGDTAWSLIVQLNDQERREYLQDRARRGFNALIVSLIEHKFTSKAPATIAGLQPFLAPGDFTQPNPVYFDHARRVIADANERGISIWLAPAYLGVNGGDEGFFQEIKKAGPTALRAYGKFVGAKLADLPNIVWMPGGDYAMPESERWAGHELALGLRDGGAKQIMTAHGCQQTAAKTFDDPAWLDVDNVYSYQPDQWRDHRASYRQSIVRPSVLIEALYENEYQSKTEPAHIRRQAWWAMTSGACGQFFGNAPLWHLGGPGYAQSNRPWREALDLAGSRDHARLGAFFRRLRWHELAPDLDDQLVTSGGGERETKVTAASARDGKLAVVYIPSRRTLTLDLSAFPGPVTAQWSNPARDAQYAAHDAKLENRPGQPLVTPGDNGAGASDWVLVLEVFQPSAGPRVDQSTMHRVPVPGGAEETARQALTAASVAVQGTNVMEAHTFTETATGERMPYRLFKVGAPVAGKKYPLVLLLHHATRGGSDNVRQIRDDAGAGVFCLPETQARHPCYVLAPQGGGKEGEAWSPISWTTLEPQPWPAEPNRNMRLCLAILDSVMAEFPVDRSRVYVSGASMGSYGTHEAITRRPHFFAGAISICGGYTTTGAERLLDTPIWTFHGDADETISVEQSRRLFAAVQSAGGVKMTYWEYPGVRHTFARDLAYANPAVIDWLFEQKR